MSRNANGLEGHGEYRPCLETLEDRLLLTTLYAGDYFIYHNSQGDTVRLSFQDTGSYDSVIEVFAHYNGAISDLPGIPSRSIGQVQGGSYRGNSTALAALETRWTGQLTSPLTSSVILRPADPYANINAGNWATTQFAQLTSNDTMWLEEGDYYPLVQDPDPKDPNHWRKVARSSRAEIFSITVITCSPTSSITLTTLNGTPFRDDRLDWTRDINPWGSTNLPLIETHMTNNPVLPPAGAGGAIVGAVHSPQRNNTPRWVGVAENTQVTGVPRMGVFAGGTVSAGLTVVSDVYRMPSTTSIGSDIRAAATDMWGSVFVVDSDAFVGTIVNPDTTGDLGGDVQAIAANAFGSLYTVDNVPGAITISSPAAFVSDADSLAYGAGWFYAVDEQTRRLIRMDLTGARADRGLLVDAASTTYQYSNVVGMAYNTLNGTLWAVATLVDTLPGTPPAPASTGPFLIQIPLGAPTNNRQTITQKVQLSVPNNTAPTPNPWPPATAPGLSTITWSPDGTKLFGVTTTNQLVTIDTSTGQYVPIGWTTGNPTPTGRLTVGGTSLTGTVVGLDFVGDTLYGLTSDGRAFYLNDANVLVNEAAVVTRNVVLLGDSGLDNLTSMTSVPGETTRVYTIALDSTGAFRLTAVPLYSSLVSVAPDGTPSIVAPLVDSADPILAYANITGLQFRTDPLAGELLYAVATQVDVDPGDGVNDATAGRHLVTIDLATGVTTVVQTLVGPSSFTTLAWHPVNDMFYGVAPTTNRLWTVNPADGSETQGPVLTAAGISGLSWVNINGTYFLLGVTGTSLYHVNPATGACTLRGNTGRVRLTGLTGPGGAALEEGYLYAVDNTNYGAPVGQPTDDFRLVSIPLTSRLIYTNGMGYVAMRGFLFDSAEPAYVYRNVTAMDVNSFNVLYAVAELVTLDPAVPVVGVNKWLVTISKITGEVTRVAQLNVADLSTIAFDAADALYGINPANRRLVQVDSATGVTTAGVPTNLSLVGIAFLDDVLYGVTPAAVYTIDPASGAGTQIENGILPVGPLGGGVTGLAAGNDPVTGDPVLWAPWLSEADATYFLLSIFTETTATQPFGKVVIGGTLAGEIRNAGDIGVVEVGFLWGGVESSQGNIGSVLMRQGGGGVPAGNYYAYQAHYDPGLGYVGESLITAFGVVNFVDSRNGARVYTAVQAESDPLADAPYWLPLDALGNPIMTEINELELDVDPRFFNDYWIAGELVDYDNGAQANAQFLNYQSGDFLRVNGTMTRYEPTSQLPDGTSVPTDWYALPLMAGQTITVDGYATMMGFFVPLLQHWPRGTPDIRLRLYDSKGNWLDSLGWESQEDWGVGSRPGIDGTQKLMEFTAPAADVYYLAVVHHDPIVGSLYYLDIYDATPSALGGVNIDGEFFGGLHSGTGLAYGYDFSAKNDGNLGAVVASGNMWWPYLRTIGGGDIGALIGGEIGSTLPGGVAPAVVESEGHVGRVASLLSWVCGSVTAGATPVGAGTLLNNNAHIQNIYTATEFLQTGGGASFVSATGSLGVVQVTTDMGGIPFTVNSDNTGAYGHIDLIDVGGDWGNPLTVPILRRGAKGDVGYVRVGGSIYVQTTYGIQVLTETTLNLGQGATLNDDGGGQLRVTPQATEMLDPASGLPLLDPVTGQPMIYVPTISYAYIGVDDDNYPGLGDGGVIANLRISGAATLTTNGQVEIGNLDLNYNPADTALRFLSISGNAPVDIYYVQCASPFEAITNETYGDIVSGDVAGMFALTLRHGSLGGAISDLGVWLHGPTTAPVPTNLAVEPQYGWYNGKINGMNITGDLPSVTVGGHLGDLRVIGRLGTVTVNADKTAAPGEWDGICGLVWAGQRIDSVEVGHGLADDGPSDRAKAGILSGGSIGSVTIKGPRRVIDGVVYGELNGAILGAQNTTVQVTQPNGTVVNVVQDSLGQIIGTGGAQLTAICGGLPLDAFRADLTTMVAPAGGVGKITFSGLGSRIHGSEAAGTYVREFSVSRESLGMQDSFIAGTSAPANSLAVGRVAAGGPGLSNVNISANGGNIGSIEALGPVADILISSFSTTDGIGKITGRDLVATYISAPGTVTTVTMTGDVTDNYNVLVTPMAFSMLNPLVLVPVVTELGGGVLLGALKTMTVAGDFVNNSFTVAGQIGTLSIGGDFQNSVLRVAGAAADLRSLEVGGDILRSERNLNPAYADEPEIRSAGSIGTVVTKTGAIFGDITTAAASGAPSSDIDAIRTAAGYFGALDVAGSLGALECLTDLGRNPALFPDNQLQIFNIQGDLGALKVSGTSVDPTNNLYADLNVGGSIGQITVSGDYFAQVFSLGDLGKITVGGLFGGDPEDPSRQSDDPLYEKRGSLEVLGRILNLSMARQGDLAADIISGGSIKSLTLSNGDVLGDIISRHGIIEGLTVTNGDIVGEVTGASIRSIRVTGGSIYGDVTATDGDIGTVKVSGVRTDPATGHIRSNVIANNGRIMTLSTTGDLGAAGQDASVSATGGIKSLTVGGNLLANVDTDGILDALSVKGGATGVGIGADGGIKKLDVTGNVTNVTIRTASGLDKLSIRGHLTDSVVSAGWNIGTVTVGGDSTGSFLLAGWDVGQNVAAVLFGDGLGGLAADQPVAMGLAPLAAVLTDLNGDGILDLVAINGGDDTISALLGNGDGTFGLRRNYLAGNEPVALAVGDVDGDGVNDLVIANRGDDSVTVLFGEGDGTFEDPTTVAVGDSPSAVALGDVDVDGDLDVAVANEGDSTVSILLNDGSRTFAADPNGPFATGLAPVAVALADLTGDNVVDLVTANRDGGSVSVRLNDGTGVFGGHFEYLLGAGAAPAAMALGDVDSVNGLDILVTDAANNNVAVFLNTGGGGFGLDGTVNVGAQPGDLAIGLFNGDANLDVVVVNRDDETVTLLLGVGDGTFNAQAAVAAGQDLAGLAVGDIDGDGDLDAIVTNQTGGSNPFNNGQAHSGNIASLTITGAMINTTVAAGIDPGPGGDFSTFVDNLPAGGYSTIQRMSVRGGFGVNPAGNTVVADSAVDAAFLRVVDPLVLVDVGTPPAPVEVPGDFGPGTAARVTRVEVAPGLWVALTGAGMANYDGLTDTINLKGTTSRSSLTLEYRGADPAPVVNIAATEDGALSNLRTIGTVQIGDVNVDGPVGTLTAGAVANGAAWMMPGGISTAKLVDLANVNVLCGPVKGWTMTGGFLGGSLTADGIGTFSTKTGASANVSATLGGIGTLTVGGDCTGDIEAFLALGSAKILGSFGGSLHAERGDMKSMTVGGAFTGRVDVERGAIGSVSVTGGNFGVDPAVNPLDTTAFRASGGIGSFTVSRGDFYGLVSTDGNLGSANVTAGVMSGKLRARGDIRSAVFGNMDGAMATAGGNFVSVKINGDMYDSSVFSGFDPGDAGYFADPAANAANVQLDAFTEAAYRRPGNTDQALGGDIGNFYVRGDMGIRFNALLGAYEFRPSTISAAVDPGVDGYCGTTDDIVGGTGYIGKAYVLGGIYGNNVPGESYGFYAASEVPVVTAWKGQSFGGNENVNVATVPPAVGALQITNVNIQLRTLTIYFNHAVNFGTITENSLVLIASRNDIIGDGDDTNVLVDTAATLTYDSVNYAAVIDLPRTLTWNSLGNYYRLSLDGSQVRDIRMSLLDGEFSGTFPSGDRRPGGDFVYDYVYGSRVLDRVPSYQFYFGCVPTVVGMLTGYYDITSGDLSDLIPGDASTRNPIVDAIIASPGTDGADPDSLPDPGTGHVPDYALYANVNDTNWDIYFGYAYADLSDPAVRLSTGRTPHDENGPNGCIADFVMASRSYVGGLASFTYGKTDHPYIETGIQEFFAWTGHSAVAALHTYVTQQDFDDLWLAYVAEINAGRPVLLGVNRLGPTVDHEVIGIGYDMATHRYACYNTYDSQIMWYDWVQSGPTTYYGVGDMTTVVVTP